MVILASDAPKPQCQPLSPKTAAAPPQNQPHSHPSQHQPSRRRHEVNVTVSPFEQWMRSGCEATLAPASAGANYVVAVIDSGFDNARSPALIVNAQKVFADGAPCSWCRLPVIRAQSHASSHQWAPRRRYQFAVSRRALTSDIFSESNSLTVMGTVDSKNSPLILTKAPYRGWRSAL